MYLTDDELTILAVALCLAAALLLYPRKKRNDSPMTNQASRVKAERNAEIRILKTRIAELEKYVEVLLKKINDYELQRRGEN